MSIELNPRGLAFSPSYTEADALEQGLGPVGPVILGVQTYLGQGALAGQLLSGDGKDFRTKLSAADQKAATLIAAQYSTYYANKYTNQAAPTHTSSTPNTNPTFTTYDISGQPVVYDQGGYKYAGAVGPKVDGIQTFYSTSGSATELVNASGQDFRAGLNAANAAKATLDAYGVSALAPTEIALLTPTTTAAFTVARVGQISGAQAANLTAAQLQAFNAGQLNTLSPTAVLQLSQAQLNALQQVAVAAPSGTGDIGGTQANGLTPGIIAKLGALQISGLSTSIVQSLLPDQLAALTGSQIAKLTNAQIASLAVTQVQLLSAPQIGAFSDAQFAGLSAMFVQALQPNQIQGLTQHQTDLIPGTVTAFTPTEVSSFTVQQLNNFVPSDVQSISTAQRKLDPPGDGKIWPTWASFGNWYAANAVAINVAARLLKK